MSVLYTIVAILLIPILLMGLILLGRYTYAQLGQPKFRWHLLTKNKYFWRVVIALLGILAVVCLLLALNSWAGIWDNGGTSDNFTPGRKIEFQQPFGNYHPNY